MTFYGSPIGWIFLILVFMGNFLKFVRELLL